MAQLKDTIVRGNLYVSEDIQIGDISILDALAGIEEGGSIEITQTQSDWEENDEAASSYIKNRPFYVSDNILDTVTSLAQTEITEFTQHNNNCYWKTENIGELLIEGAIYDVTWDGIAYRGLDCYEDTTIQNGYKCLTIGSQNESFTDYPFKITTYNDGTKIWYIFETNSTAENHIVKVVGNIPEIKKIDTKFISESIARTSDLLRKVDVAQGQENAGKILAINTDGNVYLNPAPEVMEVKYHEDGNILEFISKPQLPGNVSIDSSLTTPGNAADAKIVGDRLADLENRIGNGNNSSTSSLPTVTEADNGKILQVVNGEWTLVEVLDGNKVAY